MAVAGRIVARRICRGNDHCQSHCRITIRKGTSMSAPYAETPFVERFNQIWVQARRAELMQAGCWALLTALAGLAILAAADYWLELARAVRVGAIGAIGVASVAVAALLTVRSYRRWQREATAAVIERAFPLVGQRIR